jgi:hypothetical protein
MLEDRNARIFKLWKKNKHAEIGVNWLITFGGGGGVQNRPLVLGTLIYEGVKL